MTLDGPILTLISTTANIITIAIAVYTLYNKITKLVENKIREIVRDEINKYFKK